jgi:molybdopterin-binding protein
LSRDESSKTEDTVVKIGARNQLKGTVVDVVKGATTAVIKASDVLFGVDG